MPSREPLEDVELGATRDSRADARKGRSQADLVQESGHGWIWDGGCNLQLGLSAGRLCLVALACTCPRPFALELADRPRCTAATTDATGLRDTCMGAKVRVRCLLMLCAGSGMLSMSDRNLMFSHYCRLSNTLPLLASFRANGRIHRHAIHSKGLCSQQPLFQSAARRWGQGESGKVQGCHARRVPALRSSNGGSNNEDTMPSLPDPASLLWKDWTDIEVKAATVIWVNRMVIGLVRENSTKN